MDRVAVAAGAGVDADVCTLGGGGAGQDAVVEVDEGLEEGGAGPGVAGVVFAACDDAVICGDLFDLSFFFLGFSWIDERARSTYNTFGEVDRNPSSPPPQNTP